MIGVFITGLPRTATTFLYKHVCQLLKEELNALCVYEPFNYEPVSQILHGIKHIHDVVGEIPYDYDKLPRELNDMIYHNAQWSEEWRNEREPKSPFLGSRFWDVLFHLHTLNKPIVVKDVHAWVELPRLVLRFPDTLFIVTHRDFMSWLDEIKRRDKVIGTKYDRGGIGKFYRFIMQDFEPITDLESQCHVVFQFYKMLVNAVMGRHNVMIVTVDPVLNEDRAKAIAEMALDWVVTHAP